MSGDGRSVDAGESLVILVYIILYPRLPCSGVSDDGRAVDAGEGLVILIYIILYPCLPCSGGASGDGRAVDAGESLVIMIHCIYCIPVCLVQGERRMMEEL